MTTAQKQIYAILEEQLGIDAEEITLDSTLDDDLGADELDVVEIIMAVEGVFDLEIDDEEADELKTVKALLEYVERKVEEKK
jgi:acyl carrier protein